MDQVCRSNALYPLAIQSGPNPYFRTNGHQTPFVYAGLVGAVGIEPTTFGLKGRCSTTELRPYNYMTFKELFRVSGDSNSLYFPVFPLAVPPSPGPAGSCGAGAEISYRTF